MDANFGPNEPAPKLIFDEIGSQKPAVASSLKLLVDAGIIVPDENLEEAARQDYGLPTKDPDSARDEAISPVLPKPTDRKKVSISPDGALTLW